MTKTCIHCDISKPIDEFYKNSHKRDGRDSACIVCRKGVADARHECAVAEAARDGITHKTCSKCATLQPLEEFHEGRSKYGKSPKCKRCTSQWQSDDFQSNKQKYRDRAKRWRENCPENARAKEARDRAKCRQNLQWQIDRRILRKVDQYAKHGISRLMRSDTEYAVGWTFPQLRIHIESQFAEGMSWDLVLAGQIEIDHIIPRCAFYYEDIYDEDFKQCWALSNLRPLWKKDNRTKAYRMPDGSNGREVGRRKREAYELRLAAMAAGTSEITRDHV